MLMNSYNLTRFSVRIIDENNVMLRGFYTPEYDNGKELPHGILSNRDGNWKVVPKFIHSHTGFRSFTRDKCGETTLGEDIFEYDIVKLTWIGGKEETYLISYCTEMNYLVALPTDSLYFNDFDFYAFPEKHLEWNDFAFRMQDPWCDIQSVEVIGMLNPSLECLSFSDDGKVKVDIM